MCCGRKPKQPFFEDTCSVCYDTYDNEDKEAWVLNCDHVFCKKCVMEWILVQQTCPICRKTIEYIRSTNSSTALFLLESTLVPQRTIYLKYLFFFQMFLLFVTCFHIILLIFFDLFANLPISMRFLFIGSILSFLCSSCMFYMS